MARRPHDPSLRSAQARALIADLAGRLMAEHGIHDYALAKRKAARQLGLPDGTALPTNEEIDRALIERKNLFEPQDQTSLLLELRDEALRVMQAFERFDPVLTGSVASGAVSPHSVIELDVQAESSKDFEHYLVNQDIGFKIMDRGGQPAYLIYAEPVDVLVRLPARHHHPGHSGPKSQLNIKQLRKLVEST